MKDLQMKLDLLIEAATEMLEAYTPSYQNKWMEEDGWGVSRRKDWREDERVRNKLQSILIKIKIEGYKNETS